MKVEESKHDIGLEICKFFSFHQNIHYKWEKVNILLSNYCKNVNTLTHEYLYDWI